MSFAHAKRIAGYNRPLYAAAAAGILLGLLVTSWRGSPAALRWAAFVGVILAAWFAFASFSAFHWMFDRSPLLSGRWLANTVPPPSRWVEINAGLEETTVPLADVFPGATGKVLDIYDPASMTEPAITRARQQAAPAASLTAQPTSLPVDTAWADLVLVMLAAHEIRDRRARENFFAELRRIVAPAGKVVLVEHLRDLPAALAFGPGMFHFLPRHEWLRLANLARLELETERPITPFVRVFVYRPIPPSTAGG